jgi:UPF0755 protein
MIEEKGMKRFKGRSRFIIIAMTSVFAVFVLATIYLVANVYKPAFSPDQGEKLYISAADDYASVVRKIDSIGHPTSMFFFHKLASWLHYDQKIHTGCYNLEGESAISLIRNLTRGRQTPVKFVFNSIRTKEDLAERVSLQLMIDSAAFVQALNDSLLCDSNGFNKETITALFIPNTYEMYWDVSIEGLLKKMHKEYNLFWDESKKQAAVKVGLTPVEVSILASIVEEETKEQEDQKMVAGLYLNRLKTGMPLQADPTIRFALNDFTIKRVARGQLDVDSPYNTYIHAGLPPGPISMPSIKALQSVLHYTPHDYLYMCAKEDFSGRHNFAKTFREHSANALRYRQALNKRGIAVPK